MPSYNCVLVAYFLAIYASVLSNSAETNETQLGGPPCECVYGTLSFTEPYCSCLCEGDYAPPHCLWRVNEMQTLMITMNWTAATMSAFSSRFLEKSLREFCHLDPEEGRRNIIFRLREVRDPYNVEGEKSDIIYVNMLVRSPYVIPILDAFHLKTDPDKQASWIGLLGVINIYVLVSIPKGDSFDPSVHLWTPYKGVNITLDTVVWIIFLLLIIMIICVTEAVLIGVADGPNERLQEEASEGIELHEMERVPPVKRPFLKEKWDKVQNYIQKPRAVVATEVSGKSNDGMDTTPDSATNKNARKESCSNLKPPIGGFFVCSDMPAKVNSNAAYEEIECIYID
eukprot:Tbor_TRINITY_DN5516_c2_g2::TRINITY_DN5516_c2_g2_i1::g.13395::m.13395